MLRTTASEDDGSGHEEDLLPGGVRVDVGAVDVVGEEGGDGHELRGAGGGDGHEEHGEEEHGAGVAHERGGGGRRDEALGRLVGGDGEVEGERAESERGCQRERHSEPHQAAQQVPLVRRRRPSGDRAHPVPVVDEDGAEIADDVDDAEDEAAGAKHGEVGALQVAMDGTARLAVVYELVGADPGGAGDGHEALVHHLGAAELAAGRVHEEDEDE